MINDILITTKDKKEKLLEIKGLQEKRMNITKSKFMRIYLNGKEYFASDDPEKLN